MKELILLLLFGRTVLLTPIPVVVNSNCQKLELEKPLKVINRGAALEIRIPPGSNGSPKIPNAVTAPQIFEQLYPQGSVTATFYRKDETYVQATNIDVAVADDSYGLLLQPAKFFNVGDKFYGVTVCSKWPISNARIYWQTAME